MNIEQTWIMFLPENNPNAIYGFPSLRPEHDIWTQNCDENFILLNNEHFNSRHETNSVKQTKIFISNN